MPNTTTDTHNPKMGRSGGKIYIARRPCPHCPRVYSGTGDSRRQAAVDAYQRLARHITQTHYPTHLQGTNPTK